GGSGHETAQRYDQALSNILGRVSETCGDCETSAPALKVPGLRAGIESERDLSCEADFAAGGGSGKDGCSPPAALAGEAGAGSRVCVLKLHFDTVAHAQQSGWNGAASELRA